MAPKFAQIWRSVVAAGIRISVSKTIIIIIIIMELGEAPPPRRSARARQHEPDQARVKHNNTTPIPARL
jgi:hypothetical protein